VFELNDRLIRDKELDGLTEIPVKPDTDGQQLKPAYDEADGQADQLKESVSSWLQGESCFYLIIITLCALVILFPLCLCIDIMPF